MPKAKFNKGNKQPKKAKNTQKDWLDMESMKKYLPRVDDSQYQRSMGHMREYAVSTLGLRR